MGRAGRSGGELIPVYHFSTYFDQNYMLRGLALHRSLRRHAGAFRLYVLCLDEVAHQTLTRMAIPEIVPIALQELEAADPALLAAKATRSRVEYYFTCTAALQCFLLERYPEIDVISYMDSDLYFYSDPAPIFDEMRDGSVLIIGHRFPEHLKHLEIFGRYNVGLLAFRNDADGRTCLEWWRERCIEWCYDKLEDGKFGDQKYLDDWTTRFNGVVELRYKGANVAPWNLAGFKVRERDGQVMIDEDPLIFYHFHKMKMVSPNLFDSGLTDPKAELNAAVRNGIFAPYLRQLRELMQETGTSNVSTIRRGANMSLMARLRLMIDHKMLMTIGPITAGIYLQPLVRPLIRLKGAVARIF